MYIKVIHPKTNGKNAYSNTGSARQATNYLEGEAKKVGEQAVFFNSEKDGMTGDKAVALIDDNRKGLRKDDMKFYSLVISPSQEELAHIGNDPVRLKAYTQDVMHAYAKNFNLKDGKKLAAKDLVWVATQHNERIARGTDEGPTGVKKEGLQTHIHIMVSARDKEQKSTLNPLGTPQRFNQVRFSATGNVIWDAKFEQGRADRMQREKTTISPQAVTEKEASIRRKMKANEQIKPPVTREQAARARSKRDDKTLTPAQEVEREKRLRTQVDRINLKLEGAEPLDFEKVKAAGKERHFDKLFYGRLGRIGRDALAGKTTREPYELLRTGRVYRPPIMPEQTPVGPPTVRNRSAELKAAGAIIVETEAPLQPERQPPAGRAFQVQLLRRAAQLAAALEPQNHTQDVRAEWERE